MLPLLEKSPLKNLPRLRLKFKKLQCFTKTRLKGKNWNLKHYIRIKRRESILIFLFLPKQKGKKNLSLIIEEEEVEAEVEAVQAVYGDDWVKIQLKGLTILPKKKLAILRTEKEREIERSKTETQNSLFLLTNPNLFLQGEEQPYSLFQCPQTLSLALLTNPNLFLQEYSIPSIQATGLFFNSIFFQFKIHVFVSCSLYYWIPQIFKIFWKIRFESIFVCVRVWQMV